MFFCRLMLAVGLWVFCGGAGVFAAPQVLLQSGEASPDNSFVANVEWDDAGYIGRIRMVIFTQGTAPSAVVELPQMNPSPANLRWLSNAWVACESFVALQGAAFFYMDVPRKKGYLLDILAPEERSDWMISYTTNDGVSSDSIGTISRGRSSLFPILLRNLPEKGEVYFTQDFAFLLGDAVDAFTQWRTKEKFKEMKFLSEVAENDSLGRLVVAEMDGVGEIVYFPQGTTSTREMLALTKRQKLPEAAQRVLGGLDPPDVRVSWVGDSGEFVVEGVRDDVTSGGVETSGVAETSGTEVTSGSVVTSGWETRGTVLATGRFEGVKDWVYGGPTLDELLKDSVTVVEEEKKAEGERKDGDGKVSVSDSKKKSTSKNKPAPKSAGKKKPSRSR